MSKLTKRCRAKFDALDRINQMMDNGERGAAAAKRAVIARDTDGRSKRERTVSLGEV